MRFGKDLLNMRLCADDAVKQEQYFCPTCGGPLILKKGPKIRPYFAHHPNQPCKDTWNYDESAWQQAWQSKFPAEQQEVIIAHSAQQHRADVMVGNTVILFQSQPITVKLFSEKTKFFLNAGNDVFWVFDVRKDYGTGSLRKNPQNWDNIFWDSPFACLKKFNLVANKRLHLFLAITDSRVLKVEWIAPDSGCKRLMTDSSFRPNFLTEEGCAEAMLNKYGRFESFKQKNMPWKKKSASNIASPDKRWHICEKAETWHLDKCKKCQYNLINEYRSANKKNNIRGGLFFYCRYPQVVNPVVAQKDGESVAEVKSIWLK